MQVSWTIPFLVVVAVACGPVPPEASGARSGLTTPPSAVDAGGGLALDASLPSGAMVPGSGRTQVPASLRLPHAAVGENR